MFALGRCLFGFNPCVHMQVNAAKIPLGAKSCNNFISSLSSQLTFASSQR